MRVKIVWKLFALTTTLCLLLLATIYIGQTIFFKEYYAQRKLSDIQANMQSFKTNYLNSTGNDSIQRLEQDFYLENNARITTLDSNGSLTNAPDFYVEVNGRRFKSEVEETNTIMTIPLYNLLNIEEADEKRSLLEIGTTIRILGLNKNNGNIPVRIASIDPSFEWSFEGIEQVFNDKTIKTGVMSNSISFHEGVITKVEIPDTNAATGFIYSNELFMKKIKEFQVGLIVDEKNNRIDSLQTIEFTENNVKYNLLIDPIKNKDGSTVYVFAMASLQPVDEAVQMLKEYYGYLVLFALLLILLASFYYSKKIAKPLLQINKTTQKIAGLDFSERISISSKDEIGDLSQNINLLSSTLHSYIVQLRQDIEKEKQLENTRKEFISGVSHELKTPLSIMKSCISILKDEVATHKREHYFEAMEKEVDKMDLLIVDMLDLAKFESGTYKMVMDDFYIDKVVENICDQLYLSIAEKELHIQQSLLPVEVVANQHRIEQVITNFMTNAIRYTPQYNAIIVSTVDEINKIRISVENKGAHIPAEQLDKVWDRFYRGDASRHRSQGGTGIGLAISKNILELHGASYGAYNSEDGVVFYFYLNKK
ncbi:HAMP domain-containing protein [Paenibacillus sp. GSMTC-2017]|uniref:sensor histidine kinase n=1 Tax=Paenibacillus sp. GSMTC-2017 TaxID=2794350 RepID=UPI0018D63449|nr:HAMP domain-containing sensor histidine kinase [Paenibacillus sp. GSMTC-2017]MBH5319894.1 HAMP domain-containing protein [Paenibacillus sp. GSMTC-2017]